MIVLNIEAGPVDTIGYIVADAQSKDAVIIDVPLESSTVMVERIREHDLHVQQIILTHGHFDHVGEVAALSERLGARVSIGREDAPMLENPGTTFMGIPLSIEGMRPHTLLEHGDVVEIGSLRLRIIHAPGHTLGHVVLYEMREGVLFSGDVLFHSSIGRTDLPGGDYDTLMKSITERILTLPPETVVYPGHGPSTTIGFERGHNPFILEYLDHF
jgi:hydroxyacylglutathione hydrolase